MQRMPIKQYAVKHKMSIFQVIKAVKSGKLASETIEENGKEVTYILVDGNPAEEKTKREKEEMTTKSYDSLMQEIEALKSEMKLLKREISQLKKMMGGGVIL